MKRTGGLSLSGLLIVAAILLFQWSTSASDKASNTVTFAKDVASDPVQELRGVSSAGRDRSDVAAQLQRSSSVGEIDSRSRSRAARCRRGLPIRTTASSRMTDGSRRQEIDTIVAWVDGGAKEGDAKDLPPAPKFSDVAGSSASRMSSFR